MAEVTSYAAGTPCWVDLSTSDPEGARRFYGELFGWEFDIGAEEYGHYTTCRLRGREVAGMGGDPAPDGMPTAWTTYMATDDADASAKRVTGNGGALVVEPMDVPPFGRMAIATDSTGAMFGMWQAGELIGSSLVNEPGAVTWNELGTRDLDAAKRFYSGVFGYGWEDFDTGEGGPEYATFTVEGRSVGGALREPLPDEVPAHWTPCFAVAGADATVDTAQRLGGAVVLAPIDSPFGRYAVLRDPHGAIFSVLQSNDPAQG